MSPNLWGGGHIDFGTDPIGIGVSAQYLENQGLDSYQIFMAI